jgi:uncharacterized protein
MLILLPPSEGKSAPPAGAPLNPAGLGFPQLAAARVQVLNALVDLCIEDPAKAGEVLKVPATRPELVEQNTRLRRAPTAPAEEIYTGVLYDALGLATLSEPAARRASTQVAITSALFGLLRPGDAIPAYRLSGDVSLPTVGKVAGLWRDYLGDAVTAAVKDGLLIDLRSSTYAAFWRPPAEMADQVATVRVLQEADGERKVVSHHNKATKGHLVRALLESGANPATPTALAETLRDLGWTVELASPTAAGTRLDVVVPSI